ncbi:protein translocase subunit SecF [Chromohalobacter sp. TMW 2.2308]|uniref:protein translocase subunit SecF n=1 Tax=Chromohalobacter TaxID=42054 RepID=UPI001FFDA33A|nr:MULTISPECIES: protein translocase subunit SecF [Chromohalobacter]MCK2042513.1 protein translocase subunit SecF [Chromohalobacter moromii]MCT8514968.1 protein translocase subunit SecF [Chromohalobacter sp. TMW 2.2271]
MRQLDFMGKRRIAFAVSVLLAVVAIGALALKGLNLGLDFTGGTLVEVRYEQAPALDDLRSQLGDQGFEDAQVQTFGTSNDILVRLQQTFDNDVGQRVVGILDSEANPVDLVRAEFVGAQVGDQLRDQSGMGMLLALAVVMVYVAFRFQYKFALGALISLGHDVVIILGIFALFGLDFDLTVLAAILAVIGYSLNDTIIVYDRIRENIRKSQIDDMAQIFNESINQTLARTMATSGTTLLVLLALFFLGGDMIHNFSIALILGVVAGTFSSVYVAAALLLAIKLQRQDLIPSKKENDEEEELP